MFDNNPKDVLLPNYEQTIKRDFSASRRHLTSTYVPSYVSIKSTLPAQEYKECARYMDFMPILGGRINRPSCKIDLRERTEGIQTDVAKKQQKSLKESRTSALCLIVKSLT